MISKIEKPSQAATGEGFAKRTNDLQAKPITATSASSTKITDRPAISRLSRPIDSLLARALVLAVLGLDYSDEIALARCLARSEERRGM